MNKQITKVLGKENTKTRGKKYRTEINITETGKKNLRNSTKTLDLIRKTLERDSMAEKKTTKGKQDQTHKF
jgi:hypothetical protein